MKRLLISTITIRLNLRKMTFKPRWFFYSSYKMDSEYVKRIWRETDAVCFDVDSTVVREEAIDEFAKFCGKGEKVAKLTQAAMGGSSDFREMLLKRLTIISPTKTQLEEFVRQKSHTLTPGIEELIDLLSTRNIPVYLVSGGFRQIIRPIANHLGIPEENIFANTLIFINDEYIGIDLNEPTSKQMGKAEVISHLRKKYNYRKIVIIGDGATDAEACPPADAFIGFGGNVVRENVREKAQWFVMSFLELINEFKKNCLN